MSLAFQKPANPFSFVLSSSCRRLHKMDHTRLAQMQQNPNPIPIHNHIPYPNHNSDPSPSSSYPSNPSTVYLNPGPYNPAYYTSIEPQNAQLRHQLPGMGPQYVKPSATQAVSYGQIPAGFQPQQSADVAAAAYYPDPNVGWAAAYRQLEATPHTSTEHHNAPVQHWPPGLVPQYVPPPVTQTGQTVSYVQNAAAFQHQQSADAAAAAAAYYPGSNVGLAAAYGLSGATTHAAGVTLPNTANRLHRNTNRKNAPKKTKIVQSAWCEVCKISCDTKDVLDIHKLGKKHKKNLEKSRGPINTTPAPANTLAYLPLPIPTSSSIDKPIVGPQENPNKDLSYNARKAKRKKAAAVEDLESKRIKVLKGGAAAEAVRTCVYCNVVCNSETVYNYHIAGQKHAAVVNKFAALGGGAYVV